MNSHSASPFCAAADAVEVPQTFGLPGGVSRRRRRAAGLAREPGGHSRRRRAHRLPAVVAAVDIANVSAVVVATVIVRQERGAAPLVHPLATIFLRAPHSVRLIRQIAFHLERATYAQGGNNR